MIEDIPENSNLGALTKEWVIGPVTCPAMRTYDMRFIGYSYVASGYSWIRHRPDFSMVAVCFAGQGEVFQNGKWNLWKPNQALVAPAQVPHAYRENRTSGWKLAWVSYNKSIGYAHAAELVDTDSWPLCSTIEGLFRETRAGSQANINHHWIELIHHYTMKIIGSDIRADRLTEIWANVESDLSRPWTLLELAQRVHLSGEQLRRLCQKQYGCSPMRQLTHLRLQKAAFLLSRPGFKIDVIAREVGFKSRSAFSTRFKLCYGLTPEAYRAGCRNVTCRNSA